MKKPHILGVGEIVWDCLPTGRKLGGAPVNFAYYAQQLGGTGIPVSAVGRDSLGDETLEACASFGLDISHIKRNDLPTSRVLVSVDANGVPSYDILQGVAWDALAFSREDIALAGEADCICWGSLAQRSKESAEAILSLIDAAPKGCLKVFDVNLRQHYYTREVLEDSLLRADILKLNEDELPVLEEMFSRDAAGLCREFSLRYVILTKGGDCSEVYSGDGLISHLPTPKVKVADTVGAGDSFTAAFVSLLLQGAPVSECHRRAVEVSAFVCTCSGAINPL